MATITELTEQEKLRQRFYEQVEQALRNPPILNAGCDGANVLPQRDYRDRTCYCAGERFCSNRAWSPEKMNGALPYCTKRAHSR